jgi:hypothetical protein
MKTNCMFTRPFGRAMGLAVCALALSACCVLSAQPADGKGGPHKPPPEALAACKAVGSGSACSFMSPHGAVTGTCWAPEGKPLACKPKDAPAGSAIAPKQ